jgi:4-hydroxy-3-methylbut-2-en-1-yl diphosphate reductase
MMPATEMMVDGAEIALANPRGFCAGVDRAIDMVELAIKKFGAPIYVRHEIVHNTYVVNDLRQKGAIFIEDLTEVPTGNTVIFSAHGVSKAVRAQAKSLGLNIYDATCPLVTKVHVEVSKLQKEGFQIIMIGHEGHPEVEGTMGQGGEVMQLVETLADVEKLHYPPATKLAFVSQTTLSVDDTQEIIAALQKRFPQIRPPRKDDICYATQNRQDAVKFIAPQVDVMIVVGSATSSNSNRLREVAALKGARAYMVDTAEDVVPEWLRGARRIGVTAGASAPQVLVDALITKLKSLGAGKVIELDGELETIRFSVPKALLD